MATRRIDFEKDAERAAEVAEVVKALGHPLRLGIVSILAKRDARVGELCEALSVRQAAISQQLRILRLHRLVAVHRSQSFANYRLAEPRLVELLGCLEGCRR